jgi:hypothetical protein
VTKGKRKAKDSVDADAAAAAGGDAAPAASSGSKKKRAAPAAGSKRRPTAAEKRAAAAAAASSSSSSSAPQVVITSSGRKSKRRKLDSSSEEEEPEEDDDDGALENMSEDEDEDEEPEDDTPAHSPAPKGKGGRQHFLHHHPQKLAALNTESGLTSLAALASPSPVPGRNLIMMGDFTPGAAMGLPPTPVSASAAFPLASPAVGGGAQLTVPTLHNMVQHGFEGDGSLGTPHVGSGVGGGGGSAHLSALQTDESGRVGRYVKPQVS